MKTPYSKGAACSSSSNASASTSGLSGLDLATPSGRGGGGGHASSSSSHQRVASASDDNSATNSSKIKCNIVAGLTLGDLIRIRSHGQAQAKAPSHLGVVSEEVAAKEGGGGGGVGGEVWQEEGHGRLGIVTFCPRSRRGENGPCTTLLLRFSHPHPHPPPPSLCFLLLSLCFRLSGSLSF
jgi:hypothetical protein